MSEIPPDPRRPEPDHGRLDLALGAIAVGVIMAVILHV